MSEFAQKEAIDKTSPIDQEFERIDQAFESLGDAINNLDRSLLMVRAAKPASPEKSLEMVEDGSKSRILLRLEKIHSQILEYRGRINTITSELEI